MLFYGYLDRAWMNRISYPPNTKILSGGDAAGLLTLSVIFG